MGFEDEKRLAGEAAAELVEDGMAVGLGTGTTVDHFLAALARRAPTIRCVATSLRTESAAKELGLPVEPFDALERLDLAVDGADQVAPDGWLVKGGGAAHTREKVVAASAERFVVIASSDKVVEAISAPSRSRSSPTAPPRRSPASPRPSCATCRRARTAASSPTTSGRSTTLPSSRLGSATPGVVEHGLFGPELVTEILVGRGDEVERRTPDADTVRPWPS